MHQPAESATARSSRIPPDAPIITMVLESAASRAPAAERRAKAAVSRRDVEDALVRIELVLREEPDDEAQSLLKELAERMTLAASRVTTPDSEVAFEMHPALALLWNPSHSARTDLGRRCFAHRSGPPDHGSEGWGSTPSPPLRGRNQERSSAGVTILPVCEGLCSW